MCSAPLFQLVIWPALSRVMSAWSLRLSKNRLNWMSLVEGSSWGTAPDGGTPSLFAYSTGLAGMALAKPDPKLTCQGNDVIVHIRSNNALPAAHKPARQP